VLAKHFHISAEDALFVRPAWELQNLLVHHAREQGGEAAAFAERDAILARMNRGD
jgi:phosphotransferase system HPr-like phosphotransfer protein